MTFGNLGGSEMTYFGEAEGIPLAAKTKQNHKGRSTRKWFYCREWSLLRLLFFLGHHWGMQQFEWSPDGSACLYFLSAFLSFSVPLSPPSFLLFSQLKRSFSFPSPLLVRGLREWDLNWRLIFAACNPLLLLLLCGRLFTRVYSLKHATTKMVF